MAPIRIRRNKWIFALLLLGLSAAEERASGQTEPNALPAGEPIVRNPSAGLSSLVQLDTSRPEGGIPVVPQADAPEADDLLDLDIEALSQAPVRVAVAAPFEIEAVSVAREPRRVLQSASAIYVITQEDIRRSGVRSVPEALRMAPGLQVAQIDANRWAITSRGFNGEFSNKLLVMMDGRTIYTPLFAGVYWDAHDVVLDDIERIEVIRGPGATLWGANAVNGVINIITKNAADTQGALVIGGAGSLERGFGSLRYGGSLSDKTHYRLYFKYFDRGGFVDAMGDQTPDGWNVARGGFRIDSKRSDDDSITLQGSLYDGQTGQISNVTSLAPTTVLTRVDQTNISGGFVSGRWDHAFSETSNSVLGMYFNHAERRIPLLEEERNVFDVDFQHRFALGSRHRPLWGMGYRYYGDDLVNSLTVSFDPPSRSIHRGSFFLQDEFTLVEDLLTLTTGSKFSVNTLSGFEIQPSTRILWTPSKRQAIWASISRAVRTPSRADDDIRINAAAFTAPFPPPPTPTLVSIFGERGVDAEELTAYELGYRVQPTERLSLDLATFFNSYDDLLTTDPSAPFFETSPLPPHLVLPSTFANNMSGETYGLEIAPYLEVTDFWKISAGYTWLQVQLHRDASSGDATAEDAEGTSPHNQFNIRSYLNLTEQLDFDLSLYYVDNLPTGSIPHYLRLDARLGWHPRENLEIVVGLQNLLDDRHPEFAGMSFVGTEVPRSIYGMLRWQFGGARARRDTDGGRRDEDVNL